MPKIFAKYRNTSIKMMLQYFLPFFKTKWSEISVDDLLVRFNSDQPPLMIDVRSPEEFNGGYGHIPNARSIDILEFESQFEALEPYKETEIVTMCPGGGLSLVGVELLQKAGFKDVKSLKGGTDLWHKKGYPTTNMA
jgi:rhodanese-related sulfurtransferase